MSRPRTRMALLAARAQLGLAEQGADLLEQKRDALLRELYREVRIVFAAHDELEAAAGVARLALDGARVWLGSETVAAAAAAAAGEVAVEVESASVMGVAVPAVTPRSLVRAPGARGGAAEAYGPPVALASSTQTDINLPFVTAEASGPTIELAAQRFEEELTIAIRLATIEARVRRLAHEIRRTSSRVNALRTRIIPGLRADVTAIGLALEQRERDDRFRLKLVKRAREERSGQPRGTESGHLALVR